MREGVGSDEKVEIEDEDHPQSGANEDDGKAEEHCSAKSILGVSSILSC